jgi:hypothetical protein
VAIDDAEEVDVDALPASDEIRAPDAAPRPSSRQNQMISYSVDRTRYEAVYDTLGADGPKDVGLRTFEHFYEAEV